MSFLEFIYVLGIYIVVILLGERWVRKRFNIGKRDGWLQKHKALHPLQPWIEGGLFVVFFSLGIIIELVYGISTNLALNFLIPLYGYRAYTEWKYKKDEREYIVTIFMFITLIVLYIILYIFY